MPEELRIKVRRYFDYISEQKQEVQLDDQECVSMLS
jgi:hypothetical protein